MTRTIRQSLGAMFMCVALATLLAAPASAHLQEKSDPDDTSGPLDIRKSSFNHRDGKFILTLTTQRTWTVKTLKATEETSKERFENFFQFQLDSRGTGLYGGYTDYFVVVDNFGGDLKGKLYRWVPPYPTKESEFVSNVDVSKDGKTVKTKFRKGKVNPRDSYVGWNAYSRFSNETNCDPCNDAAPNSNLYNHQL
jgi:hypothetical protein